VRRHRLLKEREGRLTVLLVGMVHVKQREVVAVNVRKPCLGLIRRLLRLSRPQEAIGDCSGGGGARAEQRAESLGGHRGHTGQPGFEARADPPFRKRGEGSHLGPKQRQQRSGACLRVRGTRNIMGASRGESKQRTGTCNKRDIDPPASLHHKKVAFNVAECKRQYRRARGFVQASTGLLPKESAKAEQLIKVEERSGAYRTT
jgi:hypothetical protein